MHTLSGARLEEPARRAASPATTCHGRHIGCSWPGERWSLIFRVIKNFIPINVATAADVNDLNLYRFVSLAQVEAGTGSRPPWEELKARIEAQPTFTTAPQRREKREAERASGQGSRKSSRTH